MIVLYVLTQIKLLGTFYQYSSEMHMYLEVIDVFSYSLLSIVNIFICLISLSDVNINL